MELTSRTLGSAEALAQAAQLVCQALAAAPQPYAIVRLDGECVAVNDRLEAWAQPFGRSGRLVGGSLLDRDSGAISAALARVALGDVLTVDTDRLALIPERPGSYRIHLAPFRVGSMLCAAAVALQDLTEREQTQQAVRAAELRFRTLVESAGDGVGVHRDGTLLYVNPAAVRMLGCSSADEVIGRPITDFVHPEHHERVRLHLASLAHVGEAPVREATFVRMDSTPVQVEVSTFRAPVEDGFLACVLFRDVTQRSRLRAEVDRAARLESLSRFAGSVAHDFNNLLAGIQGNLAMVRLQAEQRGALLAALDAAQRETERAADLTQQLLLFSRGADTESSPVDPNQVVAEAVAVLGRMGEGGGRVETDLDPTVGTVRIGPSQLQQVVLNVLLNAREAVSAGGSIRVHTAQRTVQPREARLPERVGRWVVLSVADTGVGMDPATQARVFEPFFSTKRSGHGAGLGLSTAYGLVKQAGGWIDVQSQQGKGTTVEIHLPLHADVPIGEPKGSAPSQSPSAETVLVCDDETRLATLTAGLLDQYGYGAVTVTNCEQAIAALGAAEPACHLVLLDVSLPDGSASKVLEQMRAHGYAQPVILTSGYAEEDVPQELMSDAQVVGYLAKPYSVDRLVEAIRRVLDERGSRP